MSLPGACLHDYSTWSEKNIPQSYALDSFIAKACSNFMYLLKAIFALRVTYNHDKREKLHLRWCKASIMHKLSLYRNKNVLITDNKYWPVSKLTDICFKLWLMLILDTIPYLCWVRYLLGIQYSVLLTWNLRIAVCRLCIYPLYKDGKT